MQVALSILFGTPRSKKDPMLFRCGRLQGISAERSKISQLVCPRLSRNLILRSARPFLSKSNQKRAFYQKEELRQWTHEDDGLGSKKGERAAERKFAHIQELRAWSLVDHLNNILISRVSPLGGSAGLSHRWRFFPTRMNCFQWSNCNLPQGAGG